MILAVSVAACGAEPPLALEVRTTSAALSDKIKGVRVALFPAEKDCARIRLGGVRAPDAAYTLVVENPDKEERLSGDLVDIAPGRYSVAGWGFEDVMGRPDAFGCAPAPVEIREGERAEATLVLEPVER
jgi:hypothetical protein